MSNKVKEKGIISPIRPTSYFEDSKPIWSKEYDKGIQKIPEIIVTGRKRYIMSEDPNHQLGFINAVTGGGLNRLSPTQNARVVYDAGKALAGKMSFTDWSKSLIEGNNGIVSDEFAKEHPNLALGINGTIDLSTFSFLNAPKVSSNNQSIFNTSSKSLINTPSIAKAGDHVLHAAIPGFTGAVGGVKMGETIDNHLPEKYQGYGGLVGYILGSGIGMGIGTKILKKNVSNTPLLHSKYKKLNDVVNYPLTTASVSLQGKYPWTNKQTLKLKRQLFKDIDEARNFQLKSGYPLENQPEIRIARESEQFLKGELGHYSPQFNTVTVKSTINPYSNIPIDIEESIGGGFKGLVNHEFTHGRQQYFGKLSEYDPNAGYYVVRKDINTPILDPFRKKKAGSWIASPDEFDAELSNLQIATGKSPTESVDNIFPLQRRFNIWNKNKTREIEDLILQLRKNQEFFKQGGKMNILKFLKKGSGIHIKKKNRGKFTEYCGGTVTDECIQKGKNSSNPVIRKRATFADNARHFKHRFGGSIVEAFKLRRQILNSLNNMIND